MIRVLSRVNLCGSTTVNVALIDVVAVVLASVGRVLGPVDVSHPSFPYSGPCFSRGLGIVPSGSDVALGS